MGMIIKKLAEGSINFPTKGSTYVIEDNIGDINPIHIHFGPKKKNIRLHFTYEEFENFANSIIKQGKL
jgi:hypothetical protein